jgi:hypothetical protein
MEERKIVAGARQGTSEATVSRRELRELRETSRTKLAGKAAGTAKTKKPGLY